MQGKKTTENKRQTLNAFTIIITTTTTIIIIIIIITIITTITKLQLTS